MLSMEWLLISGVSVVYWQSYIQVSRSTSQQLRALFHPPGPFFSILIVVSRVIMAEGVMLGTIEEHISSHLLV